MPDHDPISDLAREVRGLRDDLTRYSQRLDARMRRRARAWGTIAAGASAMLLLMIAVVWWITSASVDRQAETLERAYVASCQQVRSLELVLVDVLRDRLEAAEARVPDTPAEERRTEESRRFLRDAIEKLLERGQDCDPGVVVTPTPTP